MRQLWHLWKKSATNGMIRELSSDLCVIVKGTIFDWCVRHGEFCLKEYVNALLTQCIQGIL